MLLGFGMAAALLLLVLPGTLVAAAARLSWPVAITVGPALTYGLVGLAIVPFGAWGIPWNAGTALVTLVLVGALVGGLARGIRGWLDRRPGIHVAAPTAAAGRRRWRPGYCWACC
ncbi:hypothetical protein MTER_00200 [Mycolicibacter terrae]|uniref:Transmembrane protein n=1 Tax=Mycolicibacter terrae TaxID=1788 RepID=A0AAD1MG54_9MYCO|nr:DUF6541 family protein [Mycolicibacter terrae]BBX20609.1 hypothetical protein MTER_00200 [Mycolicibacter terrae]